MTDDDVVRELRRRNDEGRRRGHRAGARRPAATAGCRRPVGAVLLVPALVVLAAVLRSGWPAAPAPDAAAAAAAPPATGAPAVPAEEQRTRAASPRRSAEPTGEPGDGRRSWTEVVTGLDRLRAGSLALRDEEALRSLHAPGAAGLRADLAAVRRLESAGLRPQGLEHEVRRVTVLAHPSVDRVVLRVEDRRSGYALVRDDERPRPSGAGAPGRVVRTVPPGEWRVWRVVLQRVGPRWRLARVRPARLRDDPTPAASATGVG